MPIEAEKKLMAEARKKGMTGRRFNRFVYGSLRKMGWKPRRERK